MQTATDHPFREDTAVPQAVVEAVAKASEALEWIERARGHLYSLHQMIGSADLLFGDAVEMLRDAGLADAADEVDRIVVGRNVLDGRWTFQIVEEFDAVYYAPVVAVVRGLESDHQGGRRHVFEARMKEQRRTHGRAHHEHRPPTAYDERIEVDERDGSHRGELG